MKSKVYEGMLLVLFLLTTALAACTDDEPEDRVKEIRMTVLPETGIMYSPFDDKQENPIECLLVKTDDNPNQIERLGMNRIEGFIYERGHEYYLSVKRTILANPPADGYNRTYKLIRILQDRLVAEPSTKVDNDIKSEADIEYNDFALSRSIPSAPSISSTPMVPSSTPTDASCPPTSRHVFGSTTSLTKPMPIGISSSRYPIRRTIRS